MNFSVFSIALFMMFISSTSAAKGSDDLLFLTRMLADAVNGFAFKLHSVLSSEKGTSYAFSPVAIANNLGILHFGARGRTAQELEHVLGYEEANITRSMAAKAYRYLRTELLLNTKPYQYSIDFVHFLYVNKYLGLSPSYVRRVEEFYRIPIRQINFITGGEESVSNTNNWVHWTTKGRIKEVEDKLKLSEDIVSISVAYFKGRWKHPFSVENTKKRIFFNEGKVKKSVQMMEITGNFFYGKPADMSMLELPIEGKNMSAVFFLPREKDGLVHIERKINQYEFIRYFQLLRERRVTVTIPIFKVTFSGTLTQNIQSLGIHQLFQETRVNLIGMFHQNCQVTMGEIKHAVTFEVNEYGIEISTSGDETTDSVTSDESKVFLADHPFLFGVVDKRTGMLLVLGRVWNL